MSEKRKPTPKEVTFGNSTLTRTKLRSGLVIEYHLADTLHLQAYKNVGQIGGEWKTNKGLGYFLGVVNRQLENLAENGKESELFTGVVRSTLSEKNPDSADLLGHIPFNGFAYTPPFTPDDLVKTGHYSYDHQDQKLKFLRLDSPIGPFIYNLFDPNNPTIGTIRLFDTDNWKPTLAEMSDLISKTITIPSFNAEEVLLGMLKREYPRSLASS